MSIKMKCGDYGNEISMSYLSLCPNLLSWKNDLNLNGKPSGTAFKSILWVNMIHLHKVSLKVLKLLPKLGKNLRYCNHSNKDHPI